MATDFTPFQSLIGGGLIGLASVLLMALYGRIMGATGILAGVLVPNGLGDWTWRAALVLGMMAGPLVFWLVTGRLPEISVPVSAPLLMLGGLLVGIGVTFGGGCTSGHGVCGLARFSSRSLAATVTFMIACAGTVFVLRHLIGG